MPFYLYWNDGNEYYKGTISNLTYQEREKNERNNKYY